MLHLHGNGDSAFSPWQLRHCQALRRAGFGVMDIDYRGFGMSPGTASEAGMYEDAEAAYKALLRRRRTAEPRSSCWATRSAPDPRFSWPPATWPRPWCCSARSPPYPTRPPIGIRFFRSAMPPRYNSTPWREYAMYTCPSSSPTAAADTLVSVFARAASVRQANQPKRLLTFDSPADDGFGGHVDTLFEHVNELKSVLAGVLPPQEPARAL